jgi:ATP-dependent RNA helicase DDX56/DBP9
VPKYIKKVRDALKHIDLEEEDPGVTDVSRLKLVSARKRWKLQHGFKLRKRDRRKERKGIFDNN